jgi:phospholipid/cholesterol/gamma-HCH transport system permease protein
VNALRALGAPWVLLLRTLTALRHGRVPWRACLTQVYELGNRSAWLVTAGLGFLGAVMVMIANVQARRFTGSLAVVGSAYFELLVRELGPVFAALLAAARTGASTSAELSWMTVGEQVEALEMSAADPLVELVAPRVAGGLLALPLLCALGTASAALSAAFVAQAAFDVDPRAFLDARFVTGSDVGCALTKSIAFGLYIPLAAAWRGLSARGGASAVGKATTDGVVNACFGCLVLDFIVDQVFLILHV